MTEAATSAEVKFTIYHFFKYFLISNSYIISKDLLFFSFFRRRSFYYSHQPKIFSFSPLSLSQTLILTICWLDFCVTDYFCTYTKYTESTLSHVLFICKILVHHQLLPLLPLGHLYSILLERLTYLEIFLSPIKPLFF